MAPSKYLAILAAVALGCANAAAVAPRDYAYDENLTCRPIVPPKTAVCGVEGAVTADKAIPLDDKPFKCFDAETCADSCGMRRECTYFGFHEQGYCQTFTNYFTRSGWFTKSGTHGIFFERDCFDCFKGKNRLLDIDFTNADPGLLWDIESDAPDTFFYDVRPRTNGLGEKSDSFRILEVTKSGKANVKYKPALPITAGGYYRIGFNAASNFMHQPTQPIPWRSLGIRITNNGKDLFASTVQNGVELKNNWVRFEMDFEAENDYTGESFLAITIDASGFEVDWYIDDIYLRLIE